MTAPDPGTLYEALIASPGRLRSMRRLTYRCGDRCLLLDAVAVPDPERVLLHQNRYKFSPEWNAARSSEAGRAANTYDGENHWKPPGSYYLGQSVLALADSEGAVVDLQCDHLAAQLKPSMFAEDWGAELAEVTVRRDGSRFAVR